MNVNVVFKHMNSTDALRQYCEKKSARLEKYFNGKVNVTWTLSTEKLQQIAHCHVTGSHIDFNIEVDNKNLYKAIDLGIDKVSRKLRKFKDTVTHHHIRQSRTALPAMG